MSRTDSGSKRAYDPEVTRGRILDAAADEFQKRGYHATSMHDIMRIAGVPGGSVYHYFPTKKSLGLAVIRERVGANLAETWIEPLRKASSASKGILAVFDAVAKNIGHEAVLGCPVNNLAWNFLWQIGIFAWHCVPCSIHGSRLSRSVCAVSLRRARVQGPIQSGWPRSWLRSFRAPCRLRKRHKTLLPFELADVNLFDSCPELRHGEA